MRKGIKKFNVGDIVKFTAKNGYGAEEGATAKVTKINSEFLYVKWIRKNRLCHQQCDGGYNFEDFELVNVLPEVELCKLGKITTFDSGFKKDELGKKVDFTLIPYSLLERIARRFMYGAEKYGKNNWKLARPEEKEELMKAALRHTFSVLNDEKDEDHAAAAITDIIMYEWLKENNCYHE